MNKEIQWLAVNRWNNQEIPADQLLAALYSDITRVLRARGAALTSDRKEQVLHAMTVGLHPIFSSPRKFVDFVVDIVIAQVHLGLDGVEPIVDRHFNPAQPSAGSSSQWTLEDRDCLRRCQ